MLNGDWHLGVSESVHIHMGSNREMAVHTQCRRHYSQKRRKHSSFQCKFILLTSEMKGGFRISGKLDIIFGVEFGIERPRIIVFD